MANNASFCAECFRDKEETIAELWCCQCSEPICKVCARHHRKKLLSHDIVSHQASVNTLSSQRLKFSRNCPTHPQQQMNMFCGQHDKIICEDCILEFHRNCKPLMNIEKASKNIKESSAFSDLIRRIENMNDTVEEIIGTFEKGLLELDKRKKDVKTEIMIFKRDIILVLEELESNLIKELDKKYEGCKWSLTRAKAELSPKISTLKTFRADIKDIRENSTNVHLFRVFKFLDGELYNEDQDIKNIIDKNTVPSIQFQKSLTDIKSKLSPLVRLSIVTKRITPQKKVNIEQQGQVHVRPKEIKSQVHVRPKEIRKTTLVSSFESRRLAGNVLIDRGCFIAQNQLLFVNTNERKELILCNRKGSETRKIMIEHPANSVASYDENRALVATPEGVIVISLNMRRHMASEELVLHPGVNCRAVASLDRKVVSYLDVRTICITDINGRNIKKISTSFHAYDIALDVRDNIYLSDSEHDKIHVITAKGEELVLYESPRIRGNIAVDIKGNVFVSKEGSSNIYELSSNEETPEVIVSKKDGLRHPKILSCHIDRNELLVLNTTNHIIQIFKM